MPKKPSKRVASKKVSAKKASAKKASAKKASAKKASAKKASAKKASAKKTTWREPGFGLGMSLEWFDNSVSFTIHGKHIEGTRWVRIQVNMTNSRAKECEMESIGYGTVSPVPFFRTSALHWDETWVVVECPDGPCCMFHASYLVTEQNQLLSTQSTIATYQVPSAVFGALHGLGSEVAYTVVRKLTLCDVMAAEIIYSDNQTEYLGDASEGGGASDWTIWAFGDEESLRLSSFVEDRVCGLVEHVEAKAAGAAYRWHCGTPHEYTGDSADTVYLRIAVLCRVCEELPNMWLVVEVWYWNLNLNQIDEPEHHLEYLLRSECDIDAWLVDETIGLTQALCDTQPGLRIAVNPVPKEIREPDLRDHNWALLFLKGH